MKTFFIGETYYNKFSLRFYIAVEEHKLASIKDNKLVIIKPYKPDSYISRHLPFGSLCDKWNTECSVGCKLIDEYIERGLVARLRAHSRKTVEPAIWRVIRGVTRDVRYNRSHRS